MITTRSRYVSGQIVPQPDDTVAVRRTFPPPIANTVLYTWKESDRMDRIAAQFLGRSQDWWKIMDVNPLVQDPHDVQPGEQIRIPRGA